MTTAGEAITAVPGEGTNAAPVPLTSEQMAAVNARFERDKAALIKAERDRWDGENAERIRQATLTAEQKAKDEADAATRRATDAEAKAGRLERMERLREAADRIGFVPTAYLRDALNTAPDGGSFDPVAIATAAHESAKADATRIVGVTPGVHSGTGNQAQRQQVAPQTGGATNNGAVDWGQWTSEQAAEHMAELRASKKLKEAAGFLRDFKRAKGLH